MKSFLNLVVAATCLIGATAIAQDTIEIDGVKYGTRSVLKESTQLGRIDADVEFCPTFCYTDLVQHSVIECRASNGPIHDGPVVDDRGGLIGNLPRWSISEVHDIREISVYESRCQRNETHTVVEVLGGTPRYFPGDPSIADQRTSSELGLVPFNCNDHPATVDPATNELVATVEIDLLIKSRPLFCR